LPKAGLSVGVLVGERKNVSTDVKFGKRTQNDLAFCKHNGLCTCMNFGTLREQNLYYLERFLTCGKPS
jgi:hypothetical protein